MTAYCNSSVCIVAVLSFIAQFSLKSRLPLEIS